jgi:hypothetical protein
MTCRTHLSIALLAVTLGVALSGIARADPLDWNMAADTGGIWTTELGQDRPGEIRALIGRTKGGRHSRYSVNVIINGSDRIELLDEMGDELPKVGFTSGRIVITTVNWPTGAGKPSETRRCFGWHADSRTYRPAICP